MTIEAYSQAALGKFSERHAASDSLLFNAATFTHDGVKYVVEVAAHVVLETKSLAAVRAFCGMHNGRLAAS